MPHPSPSPSAGAAPHQAPGILPGPFRILALDGGGVRGILEVIWLDRLERHLGGPIYSHFDLILGTGVGAILGFALGLGLRPAKIRALWGQCARLAFAPEQHRGPGSTFEAYGRDGLERMLRWVFGERTLANLRVRTVGLSFDYETQQLQSLDSSRAEPDFPLWAAVNAATRHPLYLDPFIAVEGLRPCRPRLEADFVIASFGTGRVPNGIATEVFGERSVILREFLAGEIGYVAPEALMPARSFYRFQTSVPARISPIDRLESLDELEAIAYSHLADGLDERLEELAERLREGREG